MFSGHLGRRGGDEDEAAVVAAGEGRVEGAGGQLEGADQEAVEELVVGEVEGVDGVAAAVAADQVEEAVDAAELLCGRGGPVVGLGLVEEVDGLGVDAVVGEAEVLGDGVGDLLTAVGEGEAGAGVGEALGDDGAEAAAGAGDGDHAAVEVGHGADAIRLRMTLPTISSPIRCTPRAIAVTTTNICSPHGEIDQPRQQGDLGEASAIEWLPARARWLLRSIRPQP